MDMCNTVNDSLLIFDMDGTLFDTSEANYCAYKDAAARLGYVIEYDKFMRCFTGRNYKDFLPFFGICKSEELEKIHRFKKEIYRNYLIKIRKNDILLNLIEDLKSECIMALATTASKKNTLDILKQFGMEYVFDIMLTQEDVSELKPNPECYQSVMKIAGLTAKQTIIFEDSEVGIEAAVASGASYIRVCNFNSENGSIFFEEHIEGCQHRKEILDHIGRKLNGRE